MCGSCRVGSRGGHENTFGFGQLKTSAYIDGSEIWWCDTDGAYRSQMNGAHGPHTNGAHRSHTNGVYGSRAELRFPRPPGRAGGRRRSRAGLKVTVLPKLLRLIGLAEQHPKPLAFRRT